MLAIAGCAGVSEAADHHDGGTDPGNSLAPERSGGSTPLLEWSDETLAVMIDQLKHEVGRSAETATAILRKCSFYSPKVCLSPIYFIRHQTTWQAGTSFSCAPPDMFLIT